jgi:hypothetical protein
MTLSIMSLSIMTLSIMTLSVMTFSITTICTECRYAEGFYTECRVLLNVILNVIMLNEKVYYIFSKCYGDKEPPPPYLLVQAFFKT